MSQHRPPRRTVRRSVISFIAVALALALLPSVAAAQQPPPPASSADALAELPDQELLERARGQLARVEEAQRKLAAETTALATSADLLAAKRTQLGGLTVPGAEPPAPAEGTPPVDAARAAAEHAAARFFALERRRALIDEERAAIAERTARLQAARAAASELDPLIGELLAIAAEVQRRLAAGRLAAGGVPEGLDVTALAQQQTALDARSNGWKDELAAIADAARAIPGRLEAADAEIAAADRTAIEAGRTFNEEVKRSGLRAELEGKEPSSVAALLPALAARRRELIDTYDRARAEHEAAEKAVAALEAELNALAAPAPSSITLQSEVPRVREAERAFKLAGLLSAHHRGRAEKLRALKAAVTDLDAKAAAFARVAAERADHMLRMEVVIARARELAGQGLIAPGVIHEKATTDRARAQRREAAAAAARLNAGADARAARIASLAAAIEEAAQIAKAEAAKIPDLRAAFEAQTGIARFVQDIEAMPTETVAETFEATAQALAAAEGRATDLRAKLGTVDRRVEAAEADLRALEDPLTRRAQKDNRGERRRILERLYKRVDRTPPDPAADTVEPDANGNGADASAASGAPTGSVSPVLQTLRDRHQLLASRVRTLNDRADRRNRLIQSLLEQAEALDALAAALAERLEGARKSYVAAVELQTRSGRGEIESGALPAGVAERAQRSALGPIEGDLESARAQLAANKLRREALGAQASEDSERRRALESYLALAERKLATFRDREAHERELPRRKDEDLPDAERRRIQQEVVARLEADDSRAEMVLGLFHSERAVELTDLLEAYYRDLFDAERRIENLDDQMALTERLTRFADEERKIVETALGPARARLAALRAEEADAIALGIAALDPRGRDKALADHEAATGRKLVPPEPVPPERFADEAARWADRRFLAAMRVKGAESWVQRLERRSSRMGIDADVDVHQDELGALEARKADVKLEITRLRGHPAAEWAAVEAALPPEDRPETAAERTELLSGKIGVTRALRRDVLEMAALFAVLRLLAIPIVAWLITRLGIRVGTHIVDRVSAATSESIFEQQRRADTLRSVFATAFRAVVWIVAGIYMLKVLNVDVTPLIASAGVLGLAIAFGAQTLIRDYISGFFMLMENQYRIGDVIELGGLAGVVERITLRVTVLRDIHGTVHFIPNGTVTTVSNKTKGWSRAVLDIGVAYKEDPARVMEIMREVGKEMKADETWGTKILEPPEVLGVEMFADSSVNVRMWIKTVPGEQWMVAREARRRIKKKFDERGVEIPFPQRVVYHVYPKGTPQPAESDAHHEALAE